MRNPVSKKTKQQQQNQKEKEKESRIPTSENYVRTGAKTLRTD